LLEKARVDQLFSFEMIENFNKNEKIQKPHLQKKRGVL